ncbi:MAG TPA: HAD family hydrolase [Sedimentibacter sp.]|nr:HAD family hydrolase [Sedimentibacter sp.]HNZ82959.1 HAD family hydrolase [Sedimentibacter sp.]HOH69186.1 HAD family hydrolase [Sedimentibacter sp.]HPW99483.1 HAD family hydrolase [Sedimentibacter sp.]
MKKIDTIIFDLDGTLLNTLEDIADGVNYILKKYGYPKRTCKEIKCFVGNGAARLLEQALPDGLSTRNFGSILEEYKKYYLDHNNIKTSPYEGIMDLLEELSVRKYKLAIVSNKNDKNVKSLNKIYFEDYIKTAIGQSDNINRKPAPDMVYKAIDELSADKERTVYIGDSEVDILTAKNANMHCVCVTWGFRDKEFLKDQGAEYLIDEPHELLEFLGGFSVPEEAK